MAARLVRWMGAGFLLGVLPLLLAYGIRAYYLERLPALRDVLGTGDGMLVAAAWAAMTLIDAADAARGPSAARTALVTAAWIALTVSVVAYGCLTADSVTGRVQTRGQADFMTGLSLIVLAVSAMTSAVAAGLAVPKKEGTA